MFHKKKWAGFFMWNIYNIKHVQNVAESKYDKFLLKSIVNAKCFNNGIEWEKRTTKFTYINANLICIIIKRKDTNDKFWCSNGTQRGLSHVWQTWDVDVFATKNMMYKEFFSREKMC